MSSLLAQSPRFKLKKPSSFHYDFAVLGCIMVVCGFLGIPPGNGLIPQAPLHVRSLATISLEDKDGAKVEAFHKVEEVRWSNLLQSVMCLLSLWAYAAIGTIPEGVLSGTFLYMGVSGFYGNELSDRLHCMFMDPVSRPEFDFVRNVQWSKVQCYTLIQLTAVTLVFFVSFNFFLIGGPPIAVLFPVVIAVLIPIRSSLLPKYFTAADLENLDRVGVPDEVDQNSDARSRRSSRASLRMASSITFSRTMLIANDGLASTRRTFPS